MQHVGLDWILDQKKNISRTIDELKDCGSDNSILLMLTFLFLSFLCGMKNDNIWVN